MSYTAIESMRKKNEARFGFDVGPMQPPLYVNRRQRNDLKSAALRFLHKRCEELRFDAAREAEEKKTGVYLGKSLKPGQITREEIPGDEDQSCLLRALGGRERWEPDFGSAQGLEPGDAFLLCSDGFWEYLPDGEILADCLKAQSAREWAALMLLRAAERVGTNNDNLSLITVLLKQ